VDNERGLRSESDSRDRFAAERMCRRRIANWRSPVLLIHGADDRNVTVGQTTDLVETLRAQNVAFEELIIPDEIRDPLRWSDWVRAYRATAEFFDRKLVNSREQQ
jgi:dipeptidyl aminopeptidase/acylaminoacyl peptidase